MNYLDYVRLLLNVVQDWVIPVKMGFFFPINLSRHSVTAERLKSNLNKKSLRSSVRRICHHSLSSSWHWHMTIFQPFDPNDTLLSDLLKRRFSIIWFQFFSFESMQRLWNKVVWFDNFCRFPVIFQRLKFPKGFSVVSSRWESSRKFSCQSKEKGSSASVLPFSINLPATWNWPKIGIGRRRLIPRRNANFATLFPTCATQSYILE